MEKITIITTFLLSILLFSQEENIQKIQIGKYKYELYLNESYNIDYNYNIISYNLKFKNKKINVGTYLTYRKNESSKKYSEKLEDWHPNDPRQFYKDGIILGEGEIDIDKKNHIVTNTFKTYHNDKKDFPNCEKYVRVFKQKKNGFFEIILVKEICQDTENIIFKK